MNDESKSFAEQLALEEYKSLKEEMQCAIKESVKLEFFTIGALGAFYSWYLSQKYQQYPVLIIPIPFVGYAYWRSGLLLKRANAISKYMKKYFEDDIRKGWETFFWENYDCLKMTPHVLCFWRTLFAAVIMIFTVAMIWCYYAQHICFPLCH